MLSHIRLEILVLPMSDGIVIMDSCDPFASLLTACRGCNWPIRDLPH